MKQKMWLTKDRFGYYVSNKKPVFDNLKYKHWLFSPDNEVLELSKRMAARLLGLEKHLRAGRKGIVQIELEVKCKILKGV